MTFEFATAGRIIFGEGCRRELPSLAAGFGDRAFVVTGTSRGRHEELLESLRAAGIAMEMFSVAGEPTVDRVREGIAAARNWAAAIVIGIGGGSVIDTAKAVAAFVTNDGDLMDHIEVIGGARPLGRPSAPFIAVPTTAGTGSEVTRNAVIASPAHRVKASLRSVHMLPRAAVVDPELAMSLPPAETAACGLDALTQLVEPFVSTRANPLTDALCRQGIPAAARGIRRAVANDPGARRDMALAALLSGMALANAGLGAVHGLAAVIGGMFPAAPHGAVCAALLPHVMEANWRAVRNHGSIEVVERFRETAALVTGDARAPVEDAVAWLHGLCADLEVPGLGRHGLAGADLEAVAAQALKASSMKANPAELTRDDMVLILRAAL